jgi:hypothetical protein
MIEQIDLYRFGPWRTVDLLSVGILALVISVSFKFEGRRGGWRTAFLVLGGYTVGRFLFPPQ